MQSSSSQHTTTYENELQSIHERHIFKWNGKDYLQFLSTVSSYLQRSNYSRETTLPQTDLNRHFNRGKGMRLSLDRYHSTMRLF